MTSEKRGQKFHHLMTRHYPDLGSASDWLNQISHPARPIRGITQIWVVTRHQYGISALVSQTSFRGETSQVPSRNDDRFLRLYKTDISLRRKLTTGPNANVSFLERVDCI